MKGLAKIAVIAGAMSILQGAGFGLVSASATAETTTGHSLSAGPISAGSIDPIKLSTRPLLAKGNTAPAAQPAVKAAQKPLMHLSQSSDNPTIPGEGTPQRSQGSGTR